MSIFSSFLVLLLILVEAAPSSASSVPKLGIYYCFNMSIIMLSLFLSSMVVNIHRTGDGTRKLPRWANVIFLQILGPIICICSCSCMKDKTKQSYSNHTARRLANETPPRIPANDRISESLFNNSSSNPMKALEKWFHRIENLFEDINISLSQMLAKVECKQHDAMANKAIIYEWRQVARVLDRLFCFLYLAAIVSSILLLFPMPPDIWKQWTS